MPPDRPAAVAGRWYPGRAPDLAAAVDALVAAADARADGHDAMPGAPRALVVPHAGLVYSGAVAATAFAAARRIRYRAVVLVGPSHFVPFHGVSLWSRGVWHTPLGPVTVDEGLAAAMAAGSPCVLDLPSAHTREHSLEMQLPFLARLMPGVAIAPMVLGDQGRQTVGDLADVIVRAVSAVERAGGPGGAPILLVASSDLSHYEDARTALSMDRVVIDRVEAFDDEGLMAALEREPRHACGGGAIVAVLAASKRLGAAATRVTAYADSGDVIGDKASVVGYMAAAAW
jgi:AmmeMemoRadiSam system protein B